MPEIAMTPQCPNCKKNDINVLHTYTVTDEVIGDFELAINENGKQELFFRAIDSRQVDVANSSYFVTCSNCGYEFEGIDIEW